MKIRQSAGVILAVFGFESIKFASKWFDYWCAHQPNWICVWLALKSAKEVQNCNRLILIRKCTKFYLRKFPFHIKFPNGQSQKNVFLACAFESQCFNVFFGLSSFLDLYFLCTLGFKGFSCWICVPVDLFHCLSVDIFLQSSPGNEKHGFDQWGLVAWLGGSIWTNKDSYFNGQVILLLLDMGYRSSVSGPYLGSMPGHRKLWRKFSRTTTNNIIQT